MLIYIIILLILGFLGLSNTNSISRLNRNIVIICLILFIGFRKEIGVATDELLTTTTSLYITYKNLDKEYDEKEIHTLIKKTENRLIEFVIPRRANKKVVSYVSLK